MTSKLNCFSSFFPLLCHFYNGLAQKSHFWVCVLAIVLYLSFNHRLGVHVTQKGHSSHKLMMVCMATFSAFRNKTTYWKLETRHFRAGLSLTDIPTGARHRL